VTLASGSRLGPYEILSPLGAGGMGEVYRARDTRLGREVAVKVLPAELSADAGRLRRFEKEARSASSLNHPNIVTVYDIGTSDSISYIAMELVDGVTLRQMLVQGPLPIKRLLGIGTQVAEGLAKAHEAGIVHRDLKPENVMVTKDGFAKILDFGLAVWRPLDAAGREQVAEGQHPMATSALSALPTAEAVLTEPGVVVGTVAYMSPEQALGKPLDFRSDQFSFGSMLYEMATGRKAFARASGPETMTAIIREEPEPIATLAPKSPAPLRWTIERCLAKDPKERYASTEDLARDLRTLRERVSEVVSSASTAAAERVDVAPRFGRLALAGVALAASLVGAVVTWRVLGSGTHLVPAFQRLTFRRGNIGSAAFAPDGQTVVYSASWEGNPSQLFTTRLGARESRSLGLQQARLLAISSSGEMALQMDARNLAGPVFAGTLARVPLAGGEPRRVLENVAEAAWSPDGKELAIVRDVGTKNRLEYPLGKPLAEVPLPGTFLAPRISPDGQRIAVLEYADRIGEGRLEIIDRAGSRHTLADRDAWGFGWSPDGREVYCGGPQGLSALTPDGKKRRVFRGPTPLWLCDISRDGRLLVIVFQSRSGIMALAPGDAAERDQSWLDRSVVGDISADGRLLLINETGEGEPNEAVYVRKTDGSGAVRLGDGWATAFSSDARFALTIPADGSRLLLLPVGAGETRAVACPGIEALLAAWPLPGGTRVLIQAREKGHGARLYVGNLDGGSLRAITPEGVAFSGACVSPDGKWVTAAVAGNTAMLYPVEGTLPPRSIPGLVAGDRPIRFTANGDALFVSRPDEVPATVSRVDLTTGQRRLWRQLAPSDRAGVTALRPIKMTADGESYAYTCYRTLADLFLVDLTKSEETK